MTEDIKKEEKRPIYIVRVFRELKQVVWPTPKEETKDTAVISATCIVSAAFLGLISAATLQVMTLLMK